MTGVFTLFRSAAAAAISSSEGHTFTGHIRDLKILDSHITKINIGCSTDRDLSMKWATPVTSEDIENFMRKLHFWNNNVTSLSLLGCLFNGGKREGKDVVAFAEALKHNKNLRVLEINTTAMDEQSRLILHDGLASNFGLRSFTSVSLRDRHLEGQTLASLNNAIQQNPTIENYRFIGDRVDHTQQSSFIKGYSRIMRIQPSIEFDNFQLTKENLAEKRHDHGLQNESSEAAPAPKRATL